MILLAALILGLLTGWGVARWRHVPYRAPELQHLWLVPVSLAPTAGGELLAATFGRSFPWLQPERYFPISLLGFLVFVWLNRRLPGMPVLLIGLVLNLAVITLNGGWMPLSPETASHLPGGSPPEFGRGGNQGRREVDSAAARGHQTGVPGGSVPASGHRWIPGGGKPRRHLHSCRRFLVARPFTRRPPSPAER